MQLFNNVHNWRPSELIEFPPVDGTVVRAMPGYAFVNVPKYGDFFCPGFRIRDRILREGMRVRFTAGFTVRGDIVHDVIETAAADAEEAGAS